MNIRRFLILGSVLAIGLVGCGSDDISAAESTGSGGSGSIGSQWDPTPVAPSNQGDNYDNPGQNHFELAAVDPLSTFAADVDTASYDIFRRDIGFGQRPVADGVRLEEYVNYFPYAYEPPAKDDETPFAISLEAAQSPFMAEAKLLRIGIKGRPLADVDKKGMNLVFLIDTSGSMVSSTKLPLVKKVLTEALSVLDGEDTLSIVTYAGGTGVALPPTKVSNKALITNTIKSFSAGGSTAGAAGITLAYQQAEAAFVPGGINHVILCTDGDFNVGASSTSALVELIEAKRKTGITLTALGFGIGNLNDAMMEAVTNAGNGTYAVISDADHAVQYVHQRLIAGLTFIAKDMKIQVSFNPELVLAYRLLGYENRDIADEDFTNDAVDAGEVGAGHTVTALYDVVLVGGQVPTAEGVPAPDSEASVFSGEIAVMPEELVRVAVRWKSPTATEEEAAFETSSGLASGQILDEIEMATSDFQWAAAIAAFAEILRGSPYADMANLEAIQALVAQNMGNDADREEFQALMKAAIELLAAP